MCLYFTRVREWIKLAAHLPPAKIQLPVALMASVKVLDVL